MGELTGITWTEGTWNPWHGCKKVSSGCKYCYMFRDKEKYGQNPNVVKRSKTKFTDPLKWKEPKLIFTCSWSDWFIEEADAWREEAWQVIRTTPQHTYQILTKRPERIADHLPADWGTGYPNVWLGVSTENYAAAQARIPILLKIPAVVRFISAEPLLGPIESPELIKNLDWVIIGGESGNDTGNWLYRMCSMKWIMDIITDCEKHNVPVFVKQFGTGLAKLLQYDDRHGADITEFPTEFQIRQFPKS